MEKIGSMQKHSTRAIFFVSGFGAASWAPLVPVLRERLAIGEDVLGMLLLCIGIGSLVTMPISGALAARFGCRKTLTGAAILWLAMLLALCKLSSLILVVPTLLFFGALMGCTDIVMNIQAVLVEKSLRTRIMSGMHAMWSLGGFVGAGLFGIWVGFFELSPFKSTLIAVAIMLAIFAKFEKFLLASAGEKSDTIIALPKGILMFIGVITLIAYLVEGAIMDWSGVFLTITKGFDISLAGAGFAMFSAAMLIMRFLGDNLVQNLGSRFVILGGCVISFLGFMLVIFSEVQIFLFAGFFLIGIGCSNVVPVFFSMIGRQKIMPVNVAIPAVSTLGYLGILMGPAAIGFFAHQTSLYAAFAMLAGLVVLQMFIANYVCRKML